MWRFYQAYLISKDTQTYLPVTRVLSIQIPTVELSSVFLAVILFISALAATKIAYDPIFLKNQWSSLMHMLETKLELLQFRGAMNVNNEAEGPRRRLHQHDDDGLLLLDLPLESPR
jgi:hypothetical protein